MHARASAVSTSLIAITLLAAAPVHAQTQWLERDTGTSVRLDALASDLPGGAGHFPTGVILATARIAIGHRAWAVVEIPHATASEKYVLFGGGGGTVHQDTFGNPYVGVEFARHVSGMHYEFGMRLPLVDRDKFLAVATGFGSGVEREHAFLENVTSFRLAADYHHAASARRPLGYDVRVGPLFHLDTGSVHNGFVSPGDAFGSNAYETLGQRPELFLDYSANVRLEGPRVGLGVGLAGRWLASRTANTFANGSAHDLSFVFGATHGVVRPSVRVDYPLDTSRRDALDGGATGIAVTFVPR